MKLDNVFGVHPKALELRSRRAEILAANIVNADTPHYKAKDIDFKSILANETPAVRMAATHSGHIQADQSLVAPSQLQYRVPMQPSLDGNTVDSQIEYSNFATNALEYQATLRFLNGKVKGLMLALKGQ